MWFPHGVPRISCRLGARVSRCPGYPSLGSNDAQRNGLVGGATLRSEDRDKDLSLRVSHIRASSARGNFPMDLSVLRWPFCGLPPLPLHYSDPTCRIT